MLYNSNRYILYIQEQNCHKNASVFLEHPNKPAVFVCRHESNHKYTMPNVCPKRPTQIYSCASVLCTANIVDFADVYRCNIIHAYVTSNTNCAATVQTRLLRSPYFRTRAEREVDGGCITATRQLLCVDVVLSCLVFLRIESGALFKLHKSA